VGSPNTTNADVGREMRMEFGLENVLMVADRVAPRLNVFRSLINGQDSLRQMGT
jgi:hypothetical protein